MSFKRCTSNLYVFECRVAIPKKSAKSEMPMPDGLLPVGSVNHVAMKGTFSDYKNVQNNIHNIAKPP